jgi:YHS domain-containing protein
MLSTLLCAVAVAPILTDNPITCPISGNVPLPDSPMVDYNGARFTLCGPNCVTKFMTGTAKVMATISRSGRVTGEFLFDPVSRFRAEKSRNFIEYSDYNGVRFTFDSKENKKAFDENPRLYGTWPVRECLTDAVTGRALKNYDAAIAYADYVGVRYYFGDVSSQASFMSKPSDFAPAVSNAIRLPQSIKMN